MVTIHPQFVVDQDQQRKAVLLPLAEWERIVEDLEELEDIRAYDEAKSGSQETVPLSKKVMSIMQNPYDSSYNSERLYWCHRN